MLDQDVKYKSQEAVSFDKAVAELTVIFRLITASAAKFVADDAREFFRALNSEIKALDGGAKALNKRSTLPCNKSEVQAAIHAAAHL